MHSFMVARCNNYHVSTIQNAKEIIFHIDLHSITKKFMYAFMKNDRRGLQLNASTRNIKFVSGDYMLL